MVELRFRMEDEFFTELATKLGQNLKPMDMIREGLTLLYWAAEQRRAGRDILAGKDSAPQYILSQAVLDRVPQDRPAPASEPEPQRLRAAANGD